MEVLEALRLVLPDQGGAIGLHEPSFIGNEWKYVKECIDTAWVSSVGKYVDRFEVMLSEFTGVKKTVAIVNGTAALHIALKVVGIEPDDEVLMPPLTFVATANAVAYCGAVPHFVDVSEKSLGVDPLVLRNYLKSIIETRCGRSFNKETGRCIRALLVVHTFGHPAEIDCLAEICREYKLELIEDAAESLGSYYKNTHTGNWGRVAICSFNGNKTVTTGGGGALFTNDEELAIFTKHLTTTAKVPHPWEYRHDQVGYNYRLPNINAALGCAQLEQLPLFLKQKRALAERYAEAFRDVPGVRFLREPEEARSNYWLNALLLDEYDNGERDAILGLTNKNKIMTRPSWTLMHRLPMYQDCPRMALPISESLDRRLINIPSSATLGVPNA